MLLPDHHIQTAIESGEITVTPFDPHMIQPASLDLRISDQIIDTKNLDPHPHTFTHYRLNPGVFALASTLETIHIPPHLAGRVEGKSSHGRRGLHIHATAGFIDPGFHGQITLELYNAGPDPIHITPGMPIAQLSLTTLTTPAARPYGSPGIGSHYQHQTGPTPSRAHHNQQTPTADKNTDENDEPLARIFDHIGLLRSEENQTLLDQLATALRRASDHELAIRADERARIRQQLIEAGHGPAAQHIKDNR